jgi:hypothetical protein
MSFEFICDLPWPFGLQADAAKLDSYTTVLAIEGVWPF